jgi:alpha-mannosidase
MLERLKRMKDIDGLPKIKMDTPESYFETLKKDNEEKGLLKYSGELYFEFHRGTYTSQANNKKNNRKSEFLLRDLEFYAIISNSHEKDEYPAKKLEELWKLLLLNQFHDVLPGSSIGLVYKDSTKHYNQIKKEAESERRNKINDLLKNTISDDGEYNEIISLNSLNWMREEVIELPKGIKSNQISLNGLPLGIY